MRDWEGDYVVYNPLSGDTHVLDIVAGETLKAVGECATPTAAICSHIALFLDVPNDERLAESVARTLSHLDEIGLIEPAGEC